MFTKISKKKHIDEPMKIKIRSFTSRMSKIKMPQKDFKIKYVK